MDNYPSHSEARSACATTTLSSSPTASREHGALDAAARGIAHDFGNILTVLLAKARKALDLLDLDSSARPLVEDVVEVGEFATTLARQLITLTSDAEACVEVFDLDRVLREMSGLLDGSIPGHARLVYQRSTTPLAIRGEKIRVQQLILNLVKNAAQAIATTGRICVSCSSVELAPDKIETSEGVLPGGRYAVLTVADDGVGIDELTRARIFEDSFTTKPDGRGLGLGVVRDVVRAHRGGILVDSEPGRGTIVTVLLPALGHASTLRPPPPSPLPSPLRPRQTLLVVDDDELIRAFTAQALRMDGYEVISARHGAEALSLLRARGGEIACVILDVRMPGLDGRGFVERLRGMDLDVAVVLFTAELAAGVAASFGRGEVAGHIQKPSGSKEIRAAVRAVMAERGHRSL